MPEGRSAPLCRGQRYQWLRYQQVPPGARYDAHIVARCPLPAGVSLDALRTALNYLVRRHEALRTVYVCDDAAAPGAGPRQVVCPPAPLALGTVSTERDGTPSPAEVVEELAKADFDLGADWPIRACAVTTGGEPTMVVAVLNHVAFDDWSVNVFRREFEQCVDALRAKRRVSLPPVVHQPADLAEAESGGDDARRAAAREYWSGELALVPADPYARRRRPGRGVCAHSGTLTAPALLGAAREIAGGLRVWPSAVHLAAYAAGMAAYTGERTVAHRWFTSLREGGPYMDVMTCMFSAALVRVPVDFAADFGDLVRAVAERVQTAQDRARDLAAYDELCDLTALEGMRRGRHMRLHQDVNFLNYAPRGCGTSRTRYARNPAPEAWAKSGTDTYFRVYEWQDGITASLSALDEVMDADAVETFLRGYARVIEAYREAPGRLSTGEAAGMFGFPPVAPADPATEATEMAGGGGLRDTSPRAPQSEAETALAEAIARAHPEAGELDFSHTYAEAGGLTLRMPLVVANLERLGWAGIGMEELDEPVPLHRLARLLARKAAAAAF